MKKTSRALDSKPGLFGTILGAFLILYTIISVFMFVWALINSVKTAANFYIDPVGIPQEFRFQNFLDAKTGDLVIGYESNPVKQIVALCRIIKENDGENLYFEKT